MPIEHPAHASPITAADYEAEHVGSSTLLNYGGALPDATVHAEAGAVFYDVTLAWLFVNTGTYAAPAWKPLEYITSPDASAGFHAAGSGSGGTATVFGALFEIKTGASPSAMLVATGTADPSAGGGVSFGNLYFRKNGDVTEIWRRTGAAATDWTQVT